MTVEEQQAELDYIRNHPAEFVDFNISWSVNISFAFSFSNTFCCKQICNPDQLFPYFKWRF